MNGSQIARVHYFDRQFLRTRDFDDEQRYHIDLRRRHNIGHHRWGIVHGLDIVDDGEGRIFVEPGFAVDGYGREQILATARQLDLTRFNEVDTDSLTVWLVWRQSGSQTAPPGSVRCAGDDADEAFYRWSEIPEIRLDPTDPDADPRRPAAVPEADLEFGPSRGAPRPEAPWPVQLGVVTRTALGPPPTFSIDTSGRPYAGLVGESVRAVSSGARIHLGVGEGTSRERRFAVYVPAAAAHAALEIDEGGRIDLRGQTTVRGELLIEGGAARFALGKARSRKSPWWIHRVRYSEQGQPVEALRIEMDAGTGVRNEVVVGAWSGGEFKPCLTVDDRCVVTVHGNLVVSGTMNVGGQPVMPAPPSVLPSPAGAVSTLTPEAAAALLGALLDRFPPESPEGAAFHAAVHADDATTQRLGKLAEAG
jgi:hypothetical protein